MTTPPELRPLLDALRERFPADSIWLFGSRARGDHRADSDWDIIVALPEDADPALHNPIVGWELQKSVGVPATILTVSTADLNDSWGGLNTIGHDLAREGQLLHVRQ